MVSYGGGANSTALLIGLHQHRIPVDLILFADTGAEHPHTYAYLDVMDCWLKDHGMPPITRVYKTTRDGKRLTLEDECLQSCSLPSIAYGFKRCSLKHKIGPQEKFCNHYPPCQKVWAAGKRVVKFIGYDAGEEMGIRDRNVVSQSAGVIISDAGIDISGVVGDLETQLADWSVGALLGLWFQSVFVGLCTQILSICIFLVIYGRMIEVYLVTSIGPIPFATMVNREWGSTGQNYLRSLLALGFQAFLIMICVGIYAVLVEGISTSCLLYTSRCV